MSVSGDCALTTETSESVQIKVSPKSSGGIAQTQRENYPFKLSTAQIIGTFITLSGK